MSARIQNILTLFLLILLPILAFTAGFLANELFGSPWSQPPSTTEDSADFALFWEAWGYVEESYIGEEPQDKELTYAAIRGAMQSLNDPYSVFLEPVVRQEEIISLSGNYGGIGVYVYRNEIGEAYLVPIPDNPAAAAGLRDRDVLLEINGEPVPAEQSVGEIDQRLRGEIGDELVLTIRRASDGLIEDLAIEIGEILVPSVFFRVLEDDNIGYIQISRFSGESSDELVAAVDTLLASGVTQLVLDLRGNGGGLLDASIDVVDHFLREGEIMRQVSKRDGERLYNADDDVVADLPLVVLVDGGTASAAEIVAGALQDLDRATLIGSVTFGKGSVQLVYDLSDGSSIHVTSARWFTPDGHQIDQQGLTPDISVNAANAADGQDIILETAVEYLAGLDQQVSE